MTMHHMLRSALAIGAALLLVPAAAPAAADEQAASAKPQKPKMKCRRDTETGTKIAKSICHTPEEWKTIDEAGAEQAKLLIGRTIDQGSRAGGAAASSPSGN